jgi:hypothetical protein
MPVASVSPSQQGKSAKAVRLVFSYDGRDVTLTSQQSVEMVVPPSDPVEGNEAHHGFWYELRDNQDRPLYRKVMHNPMSGDVEVFSDKAPHSVERHPMPNRKGVFVALVPDIENGQAVTLSSSEHAPERGHLPAAEIARFALKK